MTSKPRKGSAKVLSLKDAFETEYARREMERRAREEAERRQQETDLASATALYEALARDPAFLDSRGLTADQRRYTVALDHERYRIAAYFEAGVATVTLTDKRSLTPGALPRKQETAEGVEDALRLMAQFLADETR